MIYVHKKNTYSTFKSLYVECSVIKVPVGVMVWCPNTFVHIMRLKNNYVLIRDYLKHPIGVHPENIEGLSMNAGHFSFVTKHK